MNYRVRRIGSASSVGTMCLTLLPTGLWPTSSGKCHPSCNTPKTFLVREKNPIPLLVIQSNKSNKMLQTIWHQFSVQFSLLFPMVYSVLLSVLHFKTILLVDPDWLFKLFHQSGVEVSEANTASKMEHSIWKRNENWTGKWCQIVCSILFDLFLCMTSSG